MVVNHVLGRFRKRCQRLCRNLGFGLGFQQKASSVIRAALNRGKTRSVLLGAAAIVLVLGLAFHLDAFCLRLSFTMSEDFCFSRTSLLLLFPLQPFPD